MRKMVSKPHLLILAWAAISIPLIAQDTNGVPKGTPNGSAERGSPVRPPATFGTTEYGVTSVFAGSFTTTDTSARVLTNGNGYRYFASSTTSQIFLGSVSIPEGVVID